MWARARAGLTLLIDVQRQVVAQHVGLLRQQLADQLAQLLRAAIAGLRACVCTGMRVCVTV